MTVPFRKMLEEFYDLREIDVEGRPRRHRLELLGLGEVATALHGSRAKAEIPRAG